jgi:DNA-binding NtrC family response regulator
MIRHFVARALEEAGYQVVVLSPPLGALELLGEAPFDLVITNSIMPAASGAQLVARIRNEFPNLPVIHMDDQSHPVSPEFPTDVPRLGKPFSNDALLREVARQLEGKASPSLE